MSASSRFVRPSRFRHVFAEPVKPEHSYLDLELSPVTGDHSYIKGNSKFFSVAVRGGGGPVQVIPYTLQGKVPRGYPTLNGHSAAVYDTAWNPFNDNILATGSDDTTVKLWHVPDGGLTETVKDATATCSGHGKPVALLQWHPTSANVLASAAKDPAVKLWDVEHGAAKLTLDGFGALIQDLSFNADGSLLVTSTKDKLAKIWDPRARAVTAEWAPHEGGKAFKALFLAGRGQLLTVGFTKQSKREFKLWDAKALAAGPLATQEVDQAAGVMLPFYDDDTRMLYLTGKGDGNIRFFEFVDEAPFVYFLSEHRTNVSTKGADMLPKRACNVMKCELARFLKLTSDSVEPVSFIVPRKSDAFQEDIFPDTVAGVPAQSADDFFAGRTQPPKKLSLDPAKGGAVHAGSAAAAVAAKPAAAASHGSGAAAAPAAAASPVPAPTAVHVPAPAPLPVAPAPAAAAPVAAAAPEPSPAPEDTPTAPAPTLVPTPVAAPAPAAAAAASADDGAAAAALASQVEALTAQLAEAHARIATLEASEARLKRAVAAFTA